jgi:outer membrane lipoprotein-sorting protein
VDEIVAKNIDAKGGEALLRSTTSVRTTGRGTMQGQSVTVVTMSKRPFMMRNEMTMTQRMVQAFDGDNLWMAIGDNPPQVLPAGEQVEALKRTSQIDSPLLDYKSKGTDIRLGESSAEGGRQLHHLIVTPKGAPPMHYYIDAATNLESRMTIEMEQNGQKMRMEMRFSDFRTVDGRTVPFTVSQFMNGTQMGQMNFDKIEFNIPLSDDLFRLPRK